jgi:hypothetical protein
MSARGLHLFRRRRPQRRRALTALRRAGRIVAAGCLAVSLVACSGAGSSSPSRETGESPLDASSGPSTPTHPGGGIGAGGDADIASSEDSGGAGGPASDAGSPDDAGSDAGGAHDGSAIEGGAQDAGGGAGALPYMIGIKTNGVPTGPAKVESWLGRPMDLAGTTITTTSYIGSGTPYTTASGAHPLLECSFPLLSIFGESNDLSDMSQAAGGSYDATYEAMAEALASWANPLLSVRIGWELNGNWYKWSNGVGTNATYANFVSAFKRAAALVKKHNPHVLIQWNLAWGQPDPTPYWPGAYDASTNPGGVDVVSMDFYQANISQYNNGGMQSAWSLAQSGVTIDLDWMVAFAKKYGVKIALSEYGAGSPSSNGEGSGAGLDDGTWTAASIAWMNAQPPGFFLWTAWSDDAPADDIVTAQANPKEQAAWSTAWKGTHFAGCPSGCWWTGTAPP